MESSRDLINISIDMCIDQPYPQWWVHFFSVSSSYSRLINIAVVYSFVLCEYRDSDEQPASQSVSRRHVVDKLWGDAQLELCAVKCSNSGNFIHMFKNGWIDVMGRRVRADRTNEEDRNRRPINQQSTVTHISNLGSAIVTRTDKAGWLQVSRDRHFSGCLLDGWMEHWVGIGCTDEEKYGTPQRDFIYGVGLLVTSSRCRRRFKWGVECVLYWSGIEL